MCICIWRSSGSPHTFHCRCSRERSASLHSRGPQTVRSICSGPFSGCTALARCSCLDTNDIRICSRRTTSHTHTCLSTGCTCHARSIYRGTPSRNLCPSCDRSTCSVHWSDRIARALSMVVCALGTSFRCSRLSPIHLSSGRHQSSTDTSHGRSSHSDSSHRCSLLQTSS